MSLPTPVRCVAIVAYQGVLADESTAFRSVLERLPDVRVFTVGARLGPVAGPGGLQVVDTLFDEIDAADVVVVPGGLGSHRQPEIVRWVHRVRPRWVLASSTGSALLAAGGLLRGRTATTHWLAKPLLERHGAVVSDARLAIDGPFVTCAGLASTFDAADVVVRAVGGAALVRAIREEVRAAAGAERPACGRLPRRAGLRARAALRRQQPSTTRSPDDSSWRPRADAPVEVELELEER